MQQRTILCFLYLMQNYTQYMEWIQPSWAPPAWLFGPVWTVLYILIAISFGYVFVQFFKGKISGKIALPFALNIVFNIAFTPIQFGLNNLPLASIDILLVLGTLIWALHGIQKRKPWVVWMNVPYFFWVCFATILQLTITILNM